MTDDRSLLAMHPRMNSTGHSFGAKRSVACNRTELVSKLVSLLKSPIKCSEFELKSEQIGAEGDYA